MKALAVCLALSTVALALATVQSVNSSATAGKAKSGKAPVTVKITIPDGYHIYGPKSKAGVPTAIKVKGNAYRIASVSYPKTKSMTVLGEKLDVYTDQVSVPLTLQATKGVKGKQKVQLLVSSQACNDRTCMPPATQTVTVTVDFGK